MTAVERARLSIVVVVVLALQLTWVGEITVDGLHPNVMLLIPIAVGMLAGPDRGAATGFVVGIVTDLFLQSPFGLSALVFSLIGFGVGVFEGGVLRGAWWIPIVTAILASAAGEVLYALLGAIVGQSSWVTDRLVPIALVVGAWNGVFSLAIVPAVAWAVNEQRRKAHRARW